VAWERGEPAGERLAALSRRWQALGVGEAMQVPWEPAQRRAVIQSASAKATRRPAES
jgi:hypothetical protein